MLRWRLTQKAARRRGRTHHAQGFNTIGDASRRSCPLNFRLSDEAIMRFLLADVGATIIRNPRMFWLLAAAGRAAERIGSGGESQVRGLTHN